MLIGAKYFIVHVLLGQCIRIVPDGTIRGTAFKEDATTYEKTFGKAETLDIY